MPGAACSPAMTGTRGTFPRCYHPSANHRPFPGAWTVLFLAKPNRSTRLLLRSFFLAFTFDLFHTYHPTTPSFHHPTPFFSPYSPFTVLIPHLYHSLLSQSLPSLAPPTFCPPRLFPLTCAPFFSPPLNLIVHLSLVIRLPALSSFPSLPRGPVLPHREGGPSDHRPDFRPPRTTGPVRAFHPTARRRARGHRRRPIRLFFFGDPGQRAVRSWKLAGWRGRKALLVSCSRRSGPPKTFGGPGREPVSGFRQENPPKKRYVPATDVRSTGRRPGGGVTLRVSRGH